ncbi:MAG: glycosyltransferase family 2 protein [Thermoanaerobaculia bacterium]
MTGEAGGGAAEAPLFTVLLPTHNRADVLPLAIGSALAQTLDDFELFVVGDGCTDGTAEVVGRVRDPRIRWFDFPKAPGFGYAHRNRVLREARGLHVAFLAHDDLWLPDHLERLCRRLEEMGADLAYSRPLWVLRDGTVAPGIFPLGDARTRSAFLRRERNEIPASCVVHRRGCLERFGGWNETLERNGDWDLWARFLEGGAVAAFEPEPTCLHFVAAWRRDSEIGPPSLETWRRLHATPGALPEALRVPIAEGSTEQEAFWGRLGSDPAGWTLKLRDAVVAALDARLAEQNMLGPDFPEGSLAARLLALLTASVHGARRLRAESVPPGSLREKVWGTLFAWARRVTGGAARPRGGG